MCPNIRCDVFGCIILGCKQGLNYWTATGNVIRQPEGEKWPEKKRRDVALTTGLMFVFQIAFTPSPTGVTCCTSTLPVCVKCFVAFIFCQNESELSLPSTRICPWNRFWNFGKICWIASSMIWISRSGVLLRSGRWVTSPLACMVAMT